MKASKPTHASPAANDQVAKVLYSCDESSLKSNYAVTICNHVESAWDRLQFSKERGTITPEELNQTLAKLDDWLCDRLNGVGIFRLLIKAEQDHPEFIAKMPKTLACRYEEIRVARIWSSLLDPEALILLRESIEAENALKEMKAAKGEE